jgi:hypothetical protein
LEFRASKRVPLPLSASPAKKNKNKQNASSPKQGPSMPLKRYRLHFCNAAASKARPLCSSFFLGLQEKMKSTSSQDKQRKRLQIVFLTTIGLSCFAIWLFFQSSPGLIVYSYARGFICKLLSNGTIRDALRICFGI